MGDPVLSSFDDFDAHQEALRDEAEGSPEEESLAGTMEARGFTHVPFTLEALHEILGDEVEEYGEAYGEDAKRRAASEIGQTLTWIWMAGREAA